MLEIETHPNSQFSSGSDRFKDYRNLKFCYPFKVSSHTHTYLHNLIGTMKYLLMQKVVDVLTYIKNIMI